jgi:putative transposase
MPRKARLDAPGTLHHVIIRGIERRPIVDDEKDRENFVSRLGQLAVETGTGIFAWTLMTNHAHILVKSGSFGLPNFMRRLLTGYAITYNLRHRRHGHLFQNRYKSIVCEEDPYFKELVRYIHLNSIRANMVQAMKDLDRYRWSGHSAIVGKMDYPWMDCDYVLRWFGGTVRGARRSYREFVKQGIEQGRRPELVGGGLVRSLGGWSIVKAIREAGVMELSDDRILGSGEFVQKLIDESN